jgi:hypothetical protein
LAKRACRSGDGRADPRAISAALDFRRARRSMGPQLDERSPVMCYEFERQYWLRRAEEMRKRKRESEERSKQDRPAPAKPDAPAKGVEEREPVPA